MGCCSWYVCNVELKQNIPQAISQFIGLRTLTLTLMLALPFSGIAQILVYPGDANNNGLCSHVDVLYLGLGFGTNGPIRQGGSTTWGQQFLGTPWTQSTLDGINYGYLDCDGNGLIDSTDIAAIDMNIFEMVTPAGPGDTAAFASGNAPILAINLPTDSMPVNSTVTFTADITMGSAFFPVDSMYGVAYTIAYDPALIDQVIPVPHGGWLANSGLTLNRSWVDSINGLIYMVVTNTDHLNRSGFGAIGSIGIVMDDNIRVAAGFNLQLDLVFARALRSDGSSYPLIPQSDQMNIITSTSQPQPELQVQVSPNPTSGMVKVTVPDETIEKLRVIDVSGKVLFEFAPQNLNSKVLDLSAYPTGIYFLELKTEQAVTRKKILRIP